MSYKSAMSSTITVAHKGHIIQTWRDSPGQYSGQVVEGPTEGKHNTEYAGKRAKVLAALKASINSELEVKPTAKRASTPCQWTKADTARADRIFAAWMIYAETASTELPRILQEWMEGACPVSCGADDDQFEGFDFDDHGAILSIEPQGDYILLMYSAPALPLLEGLGNRQPWLSPATIEQCETYRMRPELEAEEIGGEAFDFGFLDSEGKKI